MYISFLFSSWKNKDLLAQLSELDISQISLKGILANFQVVVEQIAKLKQGKEDKLQDENEENERHDVHGNDATTTDNPEEAKKRTRICISVKSLRFFEGKTKNMFSTIIIITIYYLFSNLIIDNTRSFDDFQVYFRRRGYT